MRSSRGGMMQSEATKEKAKQWQLFKADISQKTWALFVDILKHTDVDFYPPPMIKALFNIGKKLDLSSNLKPFYSKDIKTCIELADYFKVGVYLLYDGDELVYLGSTSCFGKRVSEHMQAGKIFNGVAFFECISTDELWYKDLEKVLINYYKTKYNKPRGRPIRIHIMKSMESIESSGTKWEKYRKYRKYTAGRIVRSIC